MSVPTAPKLRVTRPRILIVEADEAERAAISSCVRLADCLGQEVGGLAESEERLRTEDIALVIWGLAGSEPETRVRDGVMELVRFGAGQVIVVGTLSESGQAYLDGNVDQVLPKPFTPSILVAAINSVLGRAPRSLMALAGRVTLKGGLEFDMSQRRLHLDGTGASFSRQEWQLLGILADQHGRFVTASEIRALGWRAGDHQATQLRIYIARLRSKLEPLDGAELISQQGRGYCLLLDSDVDGKAG